VIAAPFFAAGAALDDEDEEDGEDEDDGTPQPAA
jgi:hypothetical protein